MNLIIFNLNTQNLKKTTCHIEKKTRMSYKKPIRLYNVKLKLKNMIVFYKQ